MIHSNPNSLNAPPPQSQLGFYALEFLGHKISADGISPFPCKVKLSQIFHFPHLFTNYLNFLALLIFIVVLFLIVPQLSSLLQIFSPRNTRKISLKCLMMRILHLILSSLLSQTQLYSSIHPLMHLTALWLTPQILLLVVHFNRRSTYLASHFILF